MDWIFFCCTGIWSGERNRLIEDFHRRCTFSLTSPRGCQTRMDRQYSELRDLTLCPFRSRRTDKLSMMPSSAARSSPAWLSQFSTSMIKNGRIAAIPGSERTITLNPETSWRVGFGNEDILRRAMSQDHLSAKIHQAILFGSLEGFGGEGAYRDSFDAES